MTIEREALLFLIDRVRALQERQDMDSAKLIQVETALRGSPAGATIDDHLRNARQIVSERHERATPQQFDEIIRRLKEI